MALGGINWYALILAVAVIVARGFRVGNIYVDNILKKVIFRLFIVVGYNKKVYQYNL